MKPFDLSSKLQIEHNRKLPQGVEHSPACVSKNPRNAGFDGFKIINSPADKQHPTRQEGEAMAMSWVREVRDVAGVR